MDNLERVTKLQVLLEQQYAPAIEGTHHLYTTVEEDRITRWQNQRLLSPLAERY